jgi:hypothetical protein
VDRPRDGLSPAAQVEYDRLKAAWEQDAAARLAQRHRVDPSGTTYTFYSWHAFHTVTGVVVAALGVGSLALFAGGLAYPHSHFYTAGGGVSTSDNIWAVGLGLLLIWLGVRLFRVKVQISAEKITNYGYLRTRTVPVSKIRAVTLQPRNDQNGPRWTPRVELTNGQSFWLHPFDCGSARKPPAPGAAAAVEEIQALLRVGADDISQPETRPSGSGAE